MALVDDGLLRDGGERYGYETTLLEVSPGCVLAHDADGGQLPAGRRGRMTVDERGRNRYGHLFGDIHRTC